VEQIEKRLKYSNSRDYLNDDSIDDDNSDNYHRDKQRLAIPVELKFTRTDGTNGIANSAAAPKRPKLLQIKQQSQANKQLQFFNQLLLQNSKTQIDSTI
jgi:hypothetical protein